VNWEQSDQEGVGGGLSTSIVGMKVFRQVSLFYELFRCILLVIVGRVIHEQMGFSLWRVLILIHISLWN
jgi:hypothetical protein